MILVWKLSKVENCTNGSTNVESDCVWVDVDAIISIVSLQYESSSNIYKLDEVDANSLDEYIQTTINTYIYLGECILLACVGCLSDV